MEENTIIAHHVDRMPTTEYKQLDRMKRYRPKDGTTEDQTLYVPLSDDDSQLAQIDIAGENPFTHPPHPSRHETDHKMVNDSIWNTQRSNYNQLIFTNPFIDN